MPKRNSRRIRKLREDPVVKLALSITTPEQARHGIREVDVANHSDADQRASVRSKETRTIRKLTRVELLTRAGVITPEQALACEWYGARHELAFNFGQGTCANYSGAGGSGGLGWDHASRSIAQAEARADLEYARQVIPDWLLADFERVVLGPMDIRTLTKEGRLRFSLAAFKLHGQIGHLLLVAA